MIFIKKMCRAAQVHHILNELVMGGMVLETNMTEIMLRIEEQNKLEKEEVSFSLPYTHVPIGCSGNNTRAHNVN